MQNPRLATRYAKSLLDLAIEQNSLDAVLADVKQLAAAARDSKEFTNVLRSPVIKGDAKHRVINALFGTRISALTKAFVALLVNKGRESNLPEVAEAFITQYKELKNIKTVKLTTAVPMSDAVKDSILKKVVGSLPNNTVELKSAVNPDLIGGFVLEMDDKLFDASIRRDLNDVRNQFLKNIYISQVG